MVRDEGTAMEHNFVFKLDTEAAEVSGIRFAASGQAACSCGWESPIRHKASDKAVQLWSNHVASLSS
jgi:hypothetical protein